jgi:hypothetical protein
MRLGWDAAARAHYGYQSVEELEQAWLQHLRDTKQRSPSEIASATQPAGNAPLMSSQQMIVRQSAPPVQPLEAGRGEIYRGASPQPDDGTAQPYRPTGYGSSGVQPAAAIGAPVVKLGPPQEIPYPGPIPGYQR